MHYLTRHRARQKHLRLLGVVFAAILVASAVGAILTRNQSPAYADGGLSFSEFAVHPYASNTGYSSTSVNYYTGARLCTTASFCPTGQTLTDMNVTADGKLVAGYGDWNSNVDSFGVAAGRIGVVPLDLATGTWGGMFYAGSEALDVVRKINGYLYIPTTDPSDKTATGNSSSNISGYITNDASDGTDDGSWHFVRHQTSDTHVLDVATRNGSDLWTAGSTEWSGGTKGAARLQVSTNGGASFSIAHTDGSTPESAGSGFERYYWAAALNGKLYVKASGTTPAAPARVFDGTSWEVEPAITDDVWSSAIQLHEVFDGHFIYPSITAGTMNAFNGTTTSQIVTPSSTTPRDLFVDDNYLYILSSNGIFRTSSLTTPDWEQLAGASAVIDAHSIAVHDEYVYLGMTNGRIMRSNQTILTADVYTPTSENCFVINAGTGKITAYYAYQDNVPTNPACSRDVDIPGTIGGVVVRSIGDYSFESRQLTSVTIPDSVTSIGDSAFGYNQLASVIIPDSVTSIGRYAFSNNRLTSLEIPDSVTSIGDTAFSYNQLASLTLPDSLTVIEPYTFDNNQLTSVILPDSVTSIGWNAFSSNQLASITIPDLVTSIGDYAFGDNKLTSITIPDSVVSLSGFENNQITSVTIPDSVTSLSGFSGNKLTSITIPDSVVSLGGFGWNQLTSVVIPDSVTSLGWGAFGGNKLTSVILSNSLTSIGGFAFSNNQLTSITIPDSVTSLSVYAFSDNQLTSATIPHSVTSIDSDVFDGAANTLENLALDMATVPAAVFNNKQIKHLTLGENVTSIAAGAFVGNPLETVHLQGVTTLGTGAFASAWFSMGTVNACATGAVIPEDYIPCYNQEVARVQNSNFVRVYADHPEHYTNSLITETANSATLGVPAPVIGGYLINPASISVSYQSLSGASVQPSATFTGPGLTDYSLASFLGVYPSPSEGNLAAAYYFSGQLASLTPPAVSGYAAPQARVVSLEAGSNTVAYYYLTAAQVDEGYRIDDDGQVIAPDGTVVKVPLAPNTGFAPSSGAPMGTMFTVVVLSGVGAVLVLGVVGLYVVKAVRSRGPSR